MGQQKKQSDNLSKRQTRHVNDALCDKPASDLTGSDLVLRKCFNADVISVIVSLDTIEKVIASNVETDIMQFMWSMATKTRKLKNVLVRSYQVPSYGKIHTTAPYEIRMSN